MNHLKLTLTALLTAALVVTSLPLQAFAQVSPANRQRLGFTNILQIGKPGDEPKTVTTFYYDEIFKDDRNWFNKKHFNLLQQSYRSALDGGAWAIVQSESNGHKSVVLYWIEDFSESEKVTVYASGSGSETRYTFQPPSDKCFRYVTLSSDNKVYVDTNYANQPTCVHLSIYSSSDKLFLFSGNYQLHESAEGLVGHIPKTIDDPRQPEFAWNINEKGEFFVTYMKNDQKLNSYLNYCKARWLINEVSADYKSVVREGVFNDLVPIPIHSYQFENRGFYNLKITIECNIHPPLLPYDHSYIRSLTFNIPFDGNYHRGSTFKHCDSDNNCNPEPIDCNQLTGIARTACNMNTHFNFGVLNPSLLAMRSLVSSFLVSAEPSCGVTIPAVGNKVVDNYSPSKAIDQACRLSAEIRPKFPLFVVFTNFVVALFLLWLLVRAINSLLDHRQDDVVGGM